MTLGFTLWSCEDPHTVNMDDYMSLVHFRNGGEQTFTFAEVDETFSYYVSVCKTGFDPSITAEATLALMDEAQIEMYNLRMGTNFKMVPQDLYMIKGSAKNGSKKISFGANEGYKLAEIAFVDSHELALFVEGCAEEGKTPVVGLQLYSDTRLTDDMNYTLLTPELDVANVLFTNASFQNEFTPEDPVKNKLTGEIRMNIENMWDFECDIVVPTDPDELEALVEQANKLYGSPEDAKIYTLIPEGCFWFNAEAYTDDNAEREISKHITFSHGVTIIPFDIYVDRYFKNYVEGEEGSPLYVLPLKITNVSNQGIHIDENNGYYVMALSQEMRYMGLAKIELTEGQLSSPYTHASDGQGVGGLLDDDLTTYWHTVYNGTEGDLEYGYYIDIELDSPLAYFQFDYCTRSTNDNAIPALVTVGGSHDGETWTIIRENIPAPATGRGVWGSLAMAGSDELYEYVRFGVVESSGSAGGPLRGPTASKCTSMCELVLYGGTTAPRYKAIYDEADLEE